MSTRKLEVLIVGARFGGIVAGIELRGHGITDVTILERAPDLGWTWFFSPHEMHLNARALAPTRTIFFPGTLLREESERDHEFGYQLMKRITEVVIQRLRATQERLVECTSVRTFFNP